MSRHRFEYLDQWTWPTGSDHETLVVLARIRNRRRGPWREVLFITCNMGGHFGPDDLRRLLARANAYGLPFVIYFQEAGDQPYIERIGKAAGCEFIGGNAPGESSTPMLLSADFNVKRSVWRQIIGHVNWGPGAGPDWAKPKGIHPTTAVLAGVWLVVSSVHLPASQQKKRRMWWARFFVRALARATRGRVLFVWGGDINSDADQPLAESLPRLGIITNQQALWEIRTHGGRSIDVIATEARMVEQKAA